MLVRVLGAAAGGGFPQWNCNCSGCRRARANDPQVKPRTQASIALSSDGERWVLLNASPDLTAQILAAPCLQPDSDSRGRYSPIAAVVISGGDIDCIAGLLSLRESQKFTVYADAFVQSIIADNSIFRVLNTQSVQFNNLISGKPTALLDGDGQSLGLSVQAFPVSGKIPLYQETSNDIAQLTSKDAVVGLCVSDVSGRQIFYIPGCSQITPDILARIEGADALFFDGTLWQDDEMITSGAGTKTGQRMGHMSISGPNGSLEMLKPALVERKIFIHINNTNPILCDDSAEAALVRDAGWHVAYDGMEMRL